MSVPQTYQPTDVNNITTLTSSISNTQNNLLTTATSSDSSYSKAVDALTNVIEQYMTSSVSETSNTRKRRMIERQNGESLTTMDVLVRLEQKEKAKRQKSTKPAKTVSIATDSTKKR